MEYLVFSVGGSLLVPDGIDTGFMRKCADTLTTLSQKFGIVVITGGGATARRYIAAAKEAKITDPDDLDWLGIAATRLNAELLLRSIGSHAYPKVILDPTDIPRTRKIVIGGGWKPGWSTDYVAVRAARSVKAIRMINLSNTEFIFDKDPRKHANAKPKGCLTWDELLAITGSSRTPGMNVPFDPVAARAAKGLQVAHISGSNLGEVQNFVNGKLFKGTLIGYDHQGA